MLKKSLGIALKVFVSGALIWYLLNDIDVESAQARLQEAVATPAETQGGETTPLPATSATPATGDDSGRPDMIVRLSQGGVLPIDSKVPLEAYLAAMETEDDSKRKVHLAEHARALFGRARELIAASDRRRIRPALLMLEIYERLLRRLEARGWDRPRTPVKVPRIEKLWVALRHGVF